MHPTIDLDPNSTLQGMKRYDPVDGPVEPAHRELKKRKRKLNSYELEQEAAKKAKKEQMMFMMDEVNFPLYMIAYYINRKLT
jgi:hypothetical protein